MNSNFRAELKNGDGLYMALGAKETLKPLKR
jgi:hypothetical protein